MRFSKEVVQKLKFPNSSIISFGRFMTSTFLYLSAYYYLYTNNKKSSSFKNNFTRKFLEPIKDEHGTQAFFDYLTHRYWN
jgi:hypothetical protein